MSVLIVTPQQLSEELASAHPPTLLDVREADERAICKLPNDIHIPLGMLLDRVKELNPDDDIVVYCRSGARSASATAFLNRRGFRKVRNLDTGIIGWAMTVDSTVAVY